MIYVSITACVNWATPVGVRLAEVTAFIQYCLRKLSIPVPQLRSPPEEI
jgi:hypothetical protein